MNGVFLVDSTGQAKIDGTGTQLFIEQHAVFNSAADNMECFNSVVVTCALACECVH